MAAVNQRFHYYRCVEDHFETFVQIYGEQFERQYGFYRPYLQKVIYRYLDCGDLHNGFARVKCRDCNHEYLLAFSCKRRHFCPSCHQKRVVEFGEWLCADVLKMAPHRHFVFSIPKILRRYFLYDRKLLADLSRCAWESLVHGRRNFVDVAANFPEETGYVIDQIAQVYKNDQTAKDQRLSPQERLLFHQQESGPVMKNLKKWLSEQFAQKKTEPNSSLGKAIAYMLRHWDPLTLFLRVPDAPLDNNICEQTLKKAILHRKNSLFYKTEHGAFIGDMFMSLIHTCNLEDVNPFDYLVSLQKHSFEVFKNPGNWMPWNYQASLPVNDS